MVTAPTHLLTDPERRNVAQWNVWRTENPLRGADLRGADLRGADLTGTAGARRSDICAAVPVGSGELCSAMRNDDGTITIWAGCETFGSTKECRARIKELGGEHEAERLAWLKWVKARLAVQP